MQINSNYQAFNNYTNFKAGKVRFFSDFDGTYLPLKQQEIFLPENNQFMTNYCKSTKHFFNKTHDCLKFHITTGRSFGEFKMIMELLKKQGFKLHLPDTLVTYNGSDVFVNYGNDNGFFKENIFPFSYNFPSSDKIAKAKQDCNWDGIAILNKIKQEASKRALRFVSGDTEELVKGYEDISVYAQNKLNPDEWKKLPKENVNGVIQIKPSAYQIVDFAIGSVNSGRLKINLLLPPDYMKCSKRTSRYLDFINSITDYLDSNQVNYNFGWIKARECNKFRTKLTISPSLGKTTLNKIYDTKEAFKDVLSDNDLLLVAGNNKNDLSMLNPLEYLDSNFIAECKEKSQANKEFYDKEPEKMLEILYMLQNNSENTEYQGLIDELEHNGFFDKLEELPLYSIIVKEKEDSVLLNLKNSFPERIARKFTVISAGELEKGILSSIANYSKDNSAFRNSMKRSFKKIVSG